MCRWVFVVYVVESFCLIEQAVKQVKQWRKGYSFKNIYIDMQENTPAIKR